MCRVNEQGIFSAQPGTIFTAGNIANRFDEDDLNSCVPPPPQPSAPLFTRAFFSGFQQRRSVVRSGNAEGKARCRARPLRLRRRRRVDAPARRTADPTRGHRRAGLDLAHPPDLRNVYEVRPPFPFVAHDALTRPRPEIVVHRKKHAGKPQEVLPDLHDRTSPSPRSIYIELYSSHIQPRSAPL